jgi:hypothetical protein
MRTATLFPIAFRSDHDARLAICPDLCKNIHVSGLAELLADLEKHFGPPAEVKGNTRSTYSRQERELISERVVPEWLLRGRKLLPSGSPDQRRCEAALAALQGLYAAVWPKVKFRDEVG